MTEPTDAEIRGLAHEGSGVYQDYEAAVWEITDPSLIKFARAVLAKWGTPPAVAKWAPEEISDGERGIRWVTNDGIHGRPTDHDVREYLKRTPTAHGCHCDECKQFYATPQPTQAQAGEGEVAEHYRNAIAVACEGWTMPDGLRKHLETALWTPPTPQPTQAQAGAVPLTPFISAQRERLFYNRPENVSKGATMADWHRVVQYIEAAHGIKGGQHGAE